MSTEDPINQAATDLQKLPLHLPVQAYNREQLQAKIAERINDLIINDFSLLISILYRLDISEKKLKNLLLECQGKTAADIIAAMIIERQLQKISLRQLAKKDNPDIPDVPDVEKW